MPTRHGEGADGRRGDIAADHPAGDDPVTDRRLAIVVPVLDEVENLRSLLPALLAIGDEVVVSDGDSSDGSAALARHLGARVVEGPPGRGGQLARGAAATSAGILLFLHADTRLPAEAPRLVRQAIADGAVGGAFHLRFDQRRPLLALAERLIAWRSRWTRLPLGDQAHFVTREVFDRLGGYRDWPILEDLDFSRRLKRQGRVVLLGPPVTTSARRYLEGGIVATVARNWLIWALFACGVPPRQLARLYPQVR
ncbi:MAG TPA: TIGR04283 family arsenosugar biosynthesis glycosyltransferase [Thermoanaerobaculia bacterium]|nr:TIGR04283 family arsenosugar biosynthesis glycosyltransferase [Thermoanaerobaculia bacterium]